MTSAGFLHTVHEYIKQIERSLNEQFLLINYKYSYRFVLRWLSALNALFKECGTLVSYPDLPVHNHNYLFIAYYRSHYGTVIAYLMITLFPVSKFHISPPTT